MRRVLFIVCVLLLTGSKKGESATFSEDRILPIDSVIRENAVKKEEGLFNSYEQDGAYYLEIPEDKLGRDILVSITLLRGSAQINRDPSMRFGYGGDSMYDRLMRFVKNGDRIEIVSPQVFYLGDTKSPYDDYVRNVVAPVEHALPVVAASDSSYLVDITNLLKGDWELFSLKGCASALKLGGYLPDRSYVVDIQSFPENMNFRSVRSYTANGDAKGGFTSSSWDVVASWYLLPEKPMALRLFDSRVGYFTTLLDGMLERDDRMGKVQIANRWRLEPRPEDVEKYLRGELVEPQKPIVFYIDRATPEFLVPYFIKAVNLWQSAFEKVGFKNAIYARLAPTPEEDPDYHEGDIRYPLVSYKASPIPNAYGPMVVDPRSGEVITSHIAIYHAVQNLLQRWYFVMCGVVDPRAREYPLNQEIMGELAATVLTHEVGHTLGLRHNFMGSTIYPVDSLRSRAFVRANGLGASIMDYQRFNYIAQPEDGMELLDLLPRIGVYDDFAIEWGYRYYPEAMDLAQRTQELRNWVTEKRQDARLFYIEETNFYDPRVQSEDSGDDVIKANRFGMRNLQIIMQNLETWTQVDEPDYYALRGRYLAVLGQYSNYVNHVLRYIGGNYMDNPTMGENLIVRQPVERERQEAALAFLSDYVFQEPAWLYPEELMMKTKVSFENYVEAPFQPLISKIILKYLAIHKNNQEMEEGYTVEAYFDQLYAGIFARKEVDEKLSRYEKMMQSKFVENMVVNAENQTNFANGVSLEIKRILSQIQERARQVEEKNTDAVTVAHYKTLSNFITLWETGKNESLIK